MSESRARIIELFVSMSQTLFETTSTLCMGNAHKHTIEDALSEIELDIDNIRNELATIGKEQIT